MLRSAEWPERWCPSDGPENEQHTVTQYALVVPGLPIMWSAANILEALTDIIGKEAALERNQAGFVNENSEIE